MLSGVFGARLSTNELAPSASFSQPSGVTNVNGSAKFNEVCVPASRSALGEAMAGSVDEGDGLVDDFSEGPGDPSGDASGDGAGDVVAGGIPTDGPVAQRNHATPITAAVTTIDTAATSRVPD